MSDQSTVVPITKPSPTLLLALLTHATSLTALLGVFDTHSTVANAAIKITALVAQLLVSVAVAHARGKWLAAAEEAQQWVGSATSVDDVTSAVSAALDEKLPAHARAVVDQVKAALPPTAKLVAVNPPPPVTSSAGSTTVSSPPPAF